MLINFFLLKYKHKIIYAGSSNGRMRLSESCHLGSNPSPAANKKKKTQNFLKNFYTIISLLFL